MCPKYSLLNAALIQKFAKLNKFSTLFGWSLKMKAPDPSKIKIYSPKAQYCNTEEVSSDTAVGTSKLSTTSLLLKTKFYLFKSSL
jgi:hypothetical protein